VSESHCAAPFLRVTRDRSIDLAEVITYQNVSLESRWAWIYRMHPHRIFHSDLNMQNPMMVLRIHVATSNYYPKRWY
jgi:hypothetical protein